MRSSLTCVTDLLLHCGTLGDRHQLALLGTKLRNEKKIKIKTSIKKNIKMIIKIFSYRQRTCEE